MFKKCFSWMILSLVLCGLFMANVNAQSGWQAWSPDNTQAAISVLQRSAVLGATNSPHPHFVVVNEGSAPLSLGSLKLRYWFNCDCQREATVISGWTDWVGVLPSGLNITPKLRG